MKNITKRIIAIATFLCVAMSTFVGCSKTSTSDDGGSSSDGNTPTQQAIVQYPFEVGGEEDSAFEAPELEEEDPTQPQEEGTTVEETTEAEEDTTETVTVTNSDGQPATYVAQVTKAAGQPVTEADGQPVTDSDGQAVTEAGGEVVTDDAGEPVTEVIPVTEVVTKATGHVAEVVPKTTTATESQQTTQSSYTQKQESRYAMWLDISKDENFYFEGDFIKMTYKIKEDIPDGDYKIRISPDLSDVAGVAVSPSKVLDGTIRVNNGSIEATDVSGETSDLVFYVDNVEAKQGDTVDVYINLKNNSGLVAFNIWMYFDANAMEFVSAVPSGEFEEIADMSTGSGGGN